MDIALVMFREDGSKHAIALAEGSTTIGRSNDCAIRVPLAMVSRRHSEVVVQGRDVTLRDLGGANGTYLNSHRVEDVEAVKAGDRIKVGTVVFTLQIDGEPPTDEITRGRSDEISTKASGSAVVGTSRHVYVSDEDVDPISALEALASSADQTALEPEDDP